MESTQNTPEEWRAVVGYEGIYEVSDSGIVRSMARVILRSNAAPQAVRGRVLKPHHDRSGYRMVSLTVGRKALHRRVHRLVLEAFVGPCPSGHEGLHGDGDKLNNHVSNLRWGTRAENIQDATKHGTIAIGEGTAAAKRTEAEVVSIRQAHADGASLGRLAREYEMAVSSIEAIVKRRSWKHVA